jgi:homoserine dehydrogenase
MDGAPVFNLVERCLPGCRVLGFRGTLNSTTNLILSRMEEGLSAGAALAEAQARGIAEADPRHDLDGWDSAVKGCALAAALMGTAVPPGDVSRRGMGKVTSREVRDALREGAHVRLVVRGEPRAGGVRVTVRPERVPPGDPLVGSGADNVLMIETDLMGEIGIVERGSTVDQTAYGLFSDLLQVVRGL